MGGSVLGEDAPGAGGGGLGAALLAEGGEVGSDAALAEGRVEGAGEVGGRGAFGQFGKLVPEAVEGGEVGVDTGHLIAGGADAAEGDAVGGEFEGGGEGRGEQTEVGLAVPEEQATALGGNELND